MAIERLNYRWQKVY